MKLMRGKIFLRVIVPLLIIHTIFMFAVITNQFLLFKDISTSVNNYIKVQNLSEEDIKVTIQATDNKDEIIYLTNERNLEGRVLLYNNNKIQDVTSNIDTIKNNLLSSINKEDYIIRTYTSNDNIFDNTVIPMKKTVASSFINQLIKNKEDTEISGITLDFLYEDNLTKEIVNYKNIIKVNDKILINELNNYKEINDLISVLKISPQQVINLAYFEQNDITYYVYYNDANGSINYVTKKDEEVSFPKRQDKELSNIINTYIK